MKEDGIGPLGFSQHRSEKSGRSDEGKVTEPSQIWQQKDSD
jgi:hypothetical protein